MRDPHQGSPDNRRWRVDHEDICRDLDFDQWKHDRWFLTLGDEGIEKLADAVVELVDRMKQDRSLSDQTTRNIRNAEMLGYNEEISEVDDAHDEALAQAWSDASDEVDEDDSKDPTEGRTKWRN